MSIAIESGVGTINYGRQSAKGTPATAATTTVGYNRPKWDSGQLKSGKTNGRASYIDGNRFSSPQSYVDKVGGEVGTLKVFVQPENAGLYGAAALGVDTVTGSADPWTHTITSAGTSGQWGTWWQKVGASVGPQREMYSDSKIGKLSLKAATADKIMQYEITVFSLNPAEVYTVDAAKAEDSSDAFLWTETGGAVTFDGSVTSDVNEETLEIDTGMEPYWGNDIAPSQLIEKRGSITSAVATIATDVTLGQYRKAIYGNASPSLGDKPTKDVYYASLVTVYTRSATRKVTITRPRMEVKPDEMVIAPISGGGPSAISFGGECLKSGATPALTMVVLSGDATTYA